MACIILEMSKVKLKVSQSAGFSISDILNWRSYSSLQKLLTVVSAVIAVSWFSALWTLIIILVIAVGLGIYMSKRVIHRETGEQFGQDVKDKLKECYYYLDSFYNTVKFIGCGSMDIEEISIETAQEVDNANLFGDDDKDVFSDDWSSSGTLAVKVPCDVYLEINSLQLLIIRDFVRSWYSDFSYDPAFLKESKYLLQHACNNLVYNLSCQKSKIIAVTLIKNFQVHVGMYVKAKTSFESHQIHPKTKVPTSSSSQSFKRHSSVNEAFEKEIRFHEALSSEESEYAYLRGVVSIFLLSIIPDNVLEGKCAKSVLIEILTANVMLPLVELVSDPDWLMEKIILVTSDEKLKTLEESNSKCEQVENLNENTGCVIQSNVELESLKETDVGDSPGSPLLESDDVLTQCNGLDGDDQCREEITVSEIVNSEKFFSPLDDSSSLEASYSYDDVVSSNTNGCDTLINNALSGIEEQNSNGIEDSMTSQEDHTEEQDVCVYNNPLAENGSTSINVNEKSRDTFDFDAHRKSVDSDQNCLGDAGTDDGLSNQGSDLESSMRIHDELLSSEELFSSDSYENMELDPQKIISYTHQDFAVEESSTSSPDQTSTSFPKLSSIKNFFVDSFKTSKATSNISKPKTLSLFSDKLTSNLNPLSSKLLAKKGENKTLASDSSNQTPPQLLIDGKPVLTMNTEDAESLESSQNQDDSLSPISVHSVEMSPRYFSSTRPFFSKSTSQTDLYSINSEILEGSPIPTPSPTSHPVNMSDDSMSNGFMPKQTNMSKSYVADDRRIFQDVSIPMTLTQKEFGSNSRYSLYVIEYEALYFTEEGKSVLKSGTVKRRYREFNNLQSRLEGYPTYKKYLKNIKGPKRWPTLPFKTLDKDTVQNRRIFMEKYLTDLIQVEAICNGPDLREFLAYEGDSHIAFVKKSPDVNVLRIDKMFMRGMSEVVDRIKALPNIPQEVMSGFRGRDTAPEKIGPEPLIEWDADTIDVECEFDAHGSGTCGSVMTDACGDVVSGACQDQEEKADLFNVSQVIKDMKGSETIRETYQQEIDKVLSLIDSGQSSQGGQRLSSTASDTGLYDEKAGVASDLGDVFLDLLTQGLQGRDHWLCKENVMTSIKIVFGKMLNSYLEEVISDLTSNDQLVTYLRLARNTIWPQGQLWTQPRPQKTEAQKEVTRQQAKRCLIQFFPASSRIVVGQEDFEAMIDVFLDTLQNERLNRSEVWFYTFKIMAEMPAFPHFEESFRKTIGDYAITRTHLLYQLLDNYLEQLFPEVTNKEMLHKLLFSRSSAEGYV